MLISLIFISGGTKRNKFIIIGVVIVEDFIQQMKSLASRIERIKGNVQTEEATKTSLIMPLI